MIYILISLIQDEAIRKAFMRVFLSLLKSYRYFLVGNNDEDGVSSLLNVNKFLAEHPSSNHEFLKSLLSSQAFQKFLEDRFNANSVETIMYFDEAIIEKVRLFTILNATNGTYLCR